jgi:PAS domain S-box-containing protein
MYEHPNRYEGAVFGETYALGFSEIFIRKGGSLRVDSLGDLSGHTVAIERSSLASDTLRREHPEIRFVEYESSPEVVRAVSDGRAEAGISPQYSGRWAMREYGLTNMTTTGPLLLKSNIALCVKPGREALLARINSAYEALKADGTLNLLYDRWLNPNARRAFDWRSFWRWALVIGAPLLTLLAVVTAWNRALTARVAKRSEALRRQLSATERARENLDQSRARAASLVDFAPEAIVVARQGDGVIVDVNPQAERLFETPEARLRGRTVASLLAGEDRVSAEASAKRLVAAGLERPVRLGAAAKTGDAKGGEEVECEWWAIALPGDGAGTVRVSVIDVSDRVRAERERESLERELEWSRQFESLGRLAGGVVHDINNLLTTVVGCVRLLSTEVKAEGRGPRTLATLESAADQGAGLTRRLLEYVRGAPGSRGTLDLESVVGESVAFVRAIVADAGVKVEWEASGRAWFVHADAVEIRQVLFNLAENAREAFLKQENIVATDRRLRISVDGSKGGVRLSVEDNGPGMSKEEMERCFEPFFSTSTDRGGSGLGLPTCKNLVERMGGTIGVSVGRAGGVRVEIDVPIVAPPLATACNAEGGGAGRNDAAGLERAGVLARTVLLVEDNHPVREVLALLLSRLGWRVLAAGGTAEALRHSGGLTAGDLVISDLNLGAGGMENSVGGRGPSVETGFAALTSMRTKEPALRWIVISGSPEDLARAKRDFPRVDLFLLKPFGPEALEGAIARVYSGAMAGAGERPGRA